MTNTIPAALRRALEHLVEHATDPAVLLTVADHMDEAWCELTLRNLPDQDLRDLSATARHRAADLSKEHQNG